MNLAEFVIKIESFNANVDIPLLRKAYEFSDNAHKGQFRESGDPYIQHCLEVAFILAEQHLDTDTITAGMIHDVIEETDIKLEEIEKEFGDEIAMLMDGVTKIGEIKFESAEEEQAEYYRKMLLSMAKDIRVIIIKLADRLHNMRTLEALPREKQLRIAQETKEVYAPLAHRFGMAMVKTELEDLSFKFLEPEAYKDLLKAINEKKEEREEYIQEVVRPLINELEKSGIKSEITGRAKHLYSISHKLKDRNKPLEGIYDLFAIRAMVDTVGECYQALGIIHNLWTPVAERFRDYIATPKRNMYQSLHTTVIGPRGRMVEIQIRTHQMHRTAEYGIAAHWLYKEGKKELDETDKQMIWLREVLEWQRELSTPSEFLEYLKIDLFQDDVFVFTPKGELKQLPKGSTPLDFAFAVHSDIGQRCTGAKVNDKMVSLNTILASGDRVEIITT
ncbi:MAG: RelA/SpoT family protein, partial [candidate division Zixibacteria bacterium]|nr:RelA/SpoT family protein [candidate division Zixibacteria bacterium]